MSKDYNYGIGILRMIMCFMVILNHFMNIPDGAGNVSFLLFLRGYAVPVFMLLSFVLVQNDLLIHSKQIMLKRFERLAIPQIGWSLIYFFSFLLVIRLFSVDWSLKPVDLLFQLFTGHSLHLNTAMWFQVVMILMTLLFLLVILVFKKHHDKVLILLCIISLWLEYSGRIMFFDRFRFELRYPLGRFVEMIPLAVAGYFIGSRNLLERLKKYSLAVVLASCCIVCFIYKYSVFKGIKGYNYSGIDKIVVSFALVSMFYVIPFNKLSKKCTDIIRFLTSYTLGIYCMHILVGKICDLIISRYEIMILKESVLLEGIIIYIVSFAISFLGSLLLKKTKLRFLFN